LHSISNMEITVPEPSGFSEMCSMACLSLCLQNPGDMYVNLLEGNLLAQTLNGIC